MKIYPLAFLFLLFFIGCAESPLSKSYKIALDPSWSTLELPGREANITAFTIDLIQQIGKIEKINISVYQKSWNNLMYGLQQLDYDAICCTMQPYLFYEKLYNFSNLYLMTGPVLIARASETAKSIDDMVGKIVGIVRGSKTGIILEKYPGIIQRTYDVPQQALIDVSRETIDGSILDILTAEAYVKDLFHDKLKIFTAPLTQEGIRLIALRDQTPELIHAFDRGLKRLKSNGTYNALLKKYNLSE